MDYAQIEELASLLNDSPVLTELEVREGSVRLRLRRPAPKPKPKSRPNVTEVSSGSPRVSVTAHHSEGSSSLLPATETVTAGYVGVFHNAKRSPVNVGDTVVAGHVLGQIETMRLLNDCTATISGRLQAILVMDGQPVEYGQPLFEIVPEE